MISPARKKQARKKMRGRLMSFLEQTTDDKLRACADFLSVPIPHEFLTEKEKEKK